jgi:HAD superfamily hydrolase (TIGR01509 family)
MERPDLVIFDCDGVLVDSEVVCNEVLAGFVSELGWAMDTTEALRRFKGRAMSDIWALVEDAIGQVVTPEIDDDFRQRQLRALAERVAPVPGVPETLNALSVPYCVASNGPHEKMRTTLGALGLWGAFEGRTFSRVDVERGKPHPDLFLHAARTLEAAPNRCWVVEDSPLGIEAARRARMRAIGFAGTATADPEELWAAGAEVVLTQMLELLPLARSERGQ